MFDEQILDSYLIKLHACNFYEVRPILDGLRGILLDENLKPEEIAYCNSRIFNSKINLFSFIQEHISQKDNLQANMRKGLYKIISKYIKMRESLIMEYIQTIYDSCIKFFKIDDSGTAKQASLKPIIKIIQYIPQKEIIRQIIDPSKLTQTLLNEIKFLKIVSSVKGTIWHLLGVVSQGFDENLTEDVKTEIQQICLLQLKREMKSSKPETNLIVGAFKSFRFSLSQIYLKINEIQELYNIMVAGITEIKDLKVYKVINAALRLLEEQTQAFSAHILINPQQIFDKTLILINHKNKQVKENASSALESFMNQISQALDQDMGSHQQTFKYIMKKMFELIKDQEKNTEFHSVTVIIRAVGIFSQAISKILGEDQLHIFFQKLIEISEAKLLRVFEMSDQQYKNEFSSADDIYHGGQGFKVVLYRQKQLTGFLQSFAHILRNLSKVTDKEAQHLFQLAIVAVKQHQVMYIKYKETLYNSFVSLLMSLKIHNKIYILWLKKFVADGLIESLKMPDLLHVSLEDYYDSLKSTSTLWENIFTRPNSWTENTLQTFTDCFFGHFNELLQRSDLSYTILYEDKLEQEQNQQKQNNNENEQSDDEDNFFLNQNTQDNNHNKHEMEVEQEEQTEEQKQHKVQELMKQTQTIQYIPNNINEMQYFYRIVLLLDYLVPKLSANTIQHWIPILYRNAIAKLRQLPRSLFLLKLLKSLNSFLNDAGILRNLRSKEKNELVILMKNFYEDLFEQQRKYQDELLQDSLKVLLTVPYEIIIADNYKFFKNQMIIVYKRSFDLGEQYISLGYCAIQSLDRIVKKGKSKIVQKYLSIIIPSLSDYLMLEQKKDQKIQQDNQQQTNKQSINTDKAEMFNETLYELQIGRPQLVRKVQDFLGSIGGLCHLIVPNQSINSIQISQTLLKEIEAFQKKQKSLIAWDYEAKITFPLPLAAKKIDLNVTKFLPRVLEIALNHAEDKMKVFACELTHALVIYMIGKTAQKVEIGNRKQRESEKNNYSKIYNRIFPVLFKIAADSSHPSSKLIHQLCLQTVRWFAHSKKPESPEILELLECLMDSISSKDNNNLRELASRCIGELVKWSIKTKTKAELELQHGNIKATFRKIQSLSSHPDSYKRFGALLGLKENLKNIQNESFLVEKYILDIADTSLQISKTAGLTSDMKEIIYFLVDRISKIIIKHLTSLKKPLSKKNAKTPKRSGQFQYIEEFLDFVYKNCLFSQQQELRKSSFIYLYSIIQKGKRTFGYDIKEFFLNNSKNETLFPNQTSKISLEEFLTNIELAGTKYITHCQIFQTLICPKTIFQEHNLIKPQQSLDSIIISDDLINDYNDFIVVFLQNTKYFLNFLVRSGQDKDQTSESLIDIIYSNKPAAAMRQMTGQQYHENQSWLVFQAVKELITLLNLFDTEILAYIFDQLNFKDKDLTLFIQFFLRPGQYLYAINLHGILHDHQFYTQLKLFLINLELIFNEQKNQKKNSEQFHYNILELALKSCLPSYDPADNKPLHEILLDIDDIKEHEIKVFVKTLSLLFSQLINKAPSTLNMIETTVQHLFEWIQDYEEQIFQQKKRQKNPHQMFIEQEEEPQQDVNFDQKIHSFERVSLLLEFCLDQSTTNTDNFVLQALHEQSVIFQKYEDLLLKYLNQRWSQICKQFFLNSSKNLALFKLIIPILQKFFSQKSWKNLEIMLQEIPVLEKNLNRNQQSFLNLEIKINSLILSQINYEKYSQEFQKTSITYLQYAIKLIAISLQDPQPITIHQECLQLFGLLCRAVKKAQIKSFTFQNMYTQPLIQNKNIKDLLENIRSKYFPIRIVNLQQNSKEEIAFKTIFEAMIKMFQLSGEIQILELFFPILRENVDDYRTQKIDKFIKQFLRENYVQKNNQIQGQYIQFIMKHFLDEKLDQCADENIRFSLIRKVLIYMLENANPQVLIDFMSGLNEARNNKYFEYFLELKGIREQKSNLKKILSIQQLECFMIIFNSVYKKLSLENIKQELHQGMYGMESKGNELTKKIIVECDKILKTGLKEQEEMIEDQKSGQDVELIGIKVKEIFRVFYCQCFNLLANVLMKTQTKEKLFAQYIFLKKDRKLWELLIDTEKDDYNFDVETNFEVKAVQKFNNLSTQIDNNTSVKQLQNRYFKETMLYTQSRVQQKNQFLSENKLVQQQQQQQQQLQQQNELDVIQEQEAEDSQLQEESQQIMEAELQDGYYQSQAELVKDNYITEIELDPINKHECMKTLIYLMDFMVDKFDIKNNEWSRYILEVLQNENTCLSERVFLLKLILNRSDYFQGDAQYWFPILLQYINLQKNGGKGFHYFLRDVVTVAMDWMNSQPQIIQKGEGRSELKQLYCNCINNLIPKLAHSDKQMFKQNHKILYNLMKFFGQDSIYLDEKKVLKMLKVNDTSTQDKEKQQELQLWKMNSLKILQSAVQLKIPILKDYQEFIQNKHNNLGKYRFWNQVQQNDVYKNIAYIIINFKKDFAKDAASLYGQLFQFLTEYGLFQPLRQNLEETVIVDLLNMLQHKEKTIKERFSSILNCISTNYPYILETKKLFLNCLDLISKQTKKERAQAFKSLNIYLQKLYNEGQLKKIENAIKEIAMTLEVELQKIIVDPDLHNQRQFLELLLILSQQNILQIKEVRNMFKHKFNLIQKHYQKNPSQTFAENYYSIILALDDYYNDPDNIGQQQSEEDKQFSNIIKAALLTGLSSQHRVIRKKIFQFLDSQTQNSESPLDKLLYLIKEIYQPEEEELWLVSAVPLLISLSKKSSDYSRELYDEPLDNLAQFYDWDFRDPQYFKKFNTSQPLTPIFTLATQMSQGFMVPQPKNNRFSQFSQYKMPQGVIRNTQDIQQQSANNSFSQQGISFSSSSQSNSQQQYELPRRATQTNTFSATLVEPSTQEKRFNKLQRQTQNSQMSIFERAEQNYKNKIQKLQQNNNNKQNTQIQEQDEFEQLQQNSKNDDQDMDSRKVNVNMSQFFQKNMMDFDTVKVHQNKIRYNQHHAQGHTLSSSQDIQKRQVQIFMERQERAKQKQIQLTRKYRVGELPDIKIMYKDVIDPLIELAFYDEDISGDLFTMLFIQLFKIEESDLRKKELTYILQNLMIKSQKFNFNFVATIQKTMLELTKLGQLFPSEIIRISGLKSHAYHTSVLLLEESIFTKKYRQNILQDSSLLESNQIKKSKSLKFRRKGRGGRNRLDQEDIDQENEQLDFFKIESSEQIAYWMDLIDIYSQLSEHDQIKGVLSNVLQQQASDETVEALDLKMQGQIKVAQEELSQILENLKEQQEIQQQEEIQISNEELILQNRIKDYLQSEKQECLQMLNQWDNLSHELVNQHADNLHNPEQLGVTNMRQIFNSLIHQENQWEVLKELGQQWEQSKQGKDLLEGPLAYEMSLLLITGKDIDRARYYHKLATEQFLKIWPNYGSFASASKHEFLQNLQKNYELKEFMELDKNINITVNDCQILFKNWCNRLPSYSHDGLMCWDQILSGRELYSLTLVDRFKLDERIVNKNRSIWYVQNAKGMVKKGIFGAADPKMKEARKLRRHGDQAHFNWEFYKNTAKLKLKQLETNLQSVKVSEEDDPAEPFRKLNLIFEQERDNNRQLINEVTQYKFHFLEQHVLEKFIEVYNDKLLTTKASTAQYENYAYVLDEVFDGYIQIMESEHFNRKIDIFSTLSQNPSNTIQQQQIMFDYKTSSNEELIMLKKKEYFRFAQFCEKFLRILEGEAVQELMNILKKDYTIDSQLIAEKFVTYTFKTFELIGGIKEVELSNEIESVSQSVNESLSQSQKEKITKNINVNTDIDKRLAGLIIKMIQIIQKYPDSLGPVFQQAIENKTIPVWAFLTFLPQLMNILNSDNLCQYFENLFYQLAEKYSEAFIYQFNIIFPERYYCITECSQQLFDNFHEKYTHYFTFISSLDSLTHPEHRLIFQLQQLKEMLQYIKQEKKQKNQDSQEKIHNLIASIQEELFEDPYETYGKYNQKYFKDHKPKFERLQVQAQKFHKISEKEQQKLIDQIDQYLNQLKVASHDLPSGQLKLQDFNQYLEQFQQTHNIEIPGQYGQTSNSSYNGGGLQQPQVEQHVTISSFDKSLLCLKSIRRPKRLIVYGSDEKTYMFLVKGIEDLRLDQRIEQLYSVMNNIFETDSESRQRQLSIATFLIIPMTKTLGILEWVNETKVLGQILEKELQEQNGYLENLKENEAYNTRFQYLKKQRGEGIPRQHIPLLNKPSQEIEQEFNYQQSLVPADLLRNALQRLSMNSEAYLYLKNRFIRNYAVLCIAGYILGIGDRHLENFLVNYKTGEVISIDFGISFGEGLNLFIPELIPFRLTRSFESLMSPVGVNGLFRHSMITAMQIMKKKRHLLLDFCEVFISDPLLDWLKLSKDKRFNQSFFSQSAQGTQQQQIRDSIQISQIEDNLSSQWSAISKGEKMQIANSQNPEGRIKVVKYKLHGFKSYDIMFQELQSSRHKNAPYIKNLEKILKGKEGSIRHSLKDENVLTVEQQVDCLIEHSSDPNILGRTWIGWLPIF